MPVAELIRMSDPLSGLTTKSPSAIRLLAAVPVMVPLLPVVAENRSFWNG